jgi:hypothetical protein
VHGKVTRRGVVVPYRMLHRFASKPYGFGRGLRRQLVDAVEEAVRVGFLGSPTILIDGADPFAAPGVTPSLSCRVYRTDTGLAGAPIVEQLRAVLATRNNA